MRRQRIPQKGQKYDRDSYTFRSVSRRLLGVERGACTFSQPFNAIFGRGIISEHIPVDIDETLFGYIFLKKYTVPTSVIFKDRGGCIIGQLYCPNRIIMWGNYTGQTV